ncbi:MAG: hypothetical protein COT73_04915 [Bdellovibrio sp. CG10_big_fil_rev_8_21_14_0_10_47_8]|nr:MAG: hypothetical protein COT73_04915 [Bdellovibrio sp. CG10_big_fil_rev_8_21_14_0_10_47_8]
MSFNLSATIAYGFEVPEDKYQIEELLPPGLEIGAFAVDCCLGLFVAIEESMQRCDYVPSFIQLEAFSKDTSEWDTILQGVIEQAGLKDIEVGWQFYACYL